MQLGSVQFLVGTDYGRVLHRQDGARGAHAAALGDGVAVSTSARCASRPRSRPAWWARPRCSRRFRRRPPRPHAEGGGGWPRPRRTAGLPSPGELTMAGPAGSVLVGLSLSPGKPGPNRVHVYLVPITGTAAAAALPANIAVNGIFKALGYCGRTCRTTTVGIQLGRQGRDRRARQRRWPGIVRHAHSCRRPREARFWRSSRRPCMR